MSNIIKFLPPMTLNTNFIDHFVDQASPCAALGLVEVAGRQKGFLALKPTKEFSSTTGQNGFELGTELLGNPKVYVLHLILNFDNDHIYDVFLNLTSPVVKTVLQVWKETNDHFFFVFNGAGLHLTRFLAKPGINITCLK